MRNATEGVKSLARGFLDTSWESFSSPDKTRKLVKLKAFKKFEDTAEAVQSATAPWWRAS